jgi:GNAT superfamily N-acetyltransferase
LSSLYRIRQVDGDDDEVATELRTLHDATFGDTAPQIIPEEGWWWLLFADKEPAGFAGVERSAAYEDCVYLSRSGVMPEHRGQNLQVRLIRVREAFAKRHGFAACITDTTNNVASANSLIKAGYKLYEPSVPWSLPAALYWRRWLTQ